MFSPMKYFYHVLYLYCIATYLSDMQMQVFFIHNYTRIFLGKMHLQKLSIALRVIILASYLLLLLQFNLEI